MMSKNRNNKPGSHSIELFCSSENALLPCVYCPLINGVSNEESKWMNTWESKTSCFIEWFFTCSECR